MLFVCVKKFTPYHQDYGLTDEFRLQVISDAQVLGVKGAAIKNNVHVTSVYKWMRDCNAERVQR